MSKLTGPDEKTIAKLDAILQKEDLVLKPSTRLRSEIVLADGSTRPLKLRNYQVQMILHLIAMRRFIVGDDCGLGKCVTGDTLIVTDQGVRRIDEMHDWSGMAPDTFAPPKTPVSVLVDGTARPVKNFYRGGVKPTVTITTRYGFQNSGSQVHPVMVRRDGVDQWVKMADLQVGDVMCIDRTSTAFPETNSSHRQGCSEVDWGEFGLSQRFLSMGTVRDALVAVIACGKAHGGHIEHIPEQNDITEVTPEQNDFCYVIPSAPNELIRQLQIFLLRLGIVSRRSPAASGDLSQSQLSFDAKSGPESVYSLLQDQGYFYDPIVSITQGEAEVYDLEVDHPDHSFIGNGFVNHNTLMTIASCCYLWDRGEAEKVVVLTKKSVVNQWCDEVHRFTTGVATFPAKGTPKQRAKAYAAFKDHVGPAVLVMGYRSAVQDFEELQGWKIGVFVLDEATMVKNSSSQVHRVVRYLASDEVSDRVWGLTATLIKNNLMEGYGIYRVVVPGLFHPTETAFMNDFCIVQMQPIGKGRKVPVVVGYRRADVERFKQIIRPYYLGRAKHTVAKELPVLTTKVVHVGMSGAQHLKYAEALAGLLLVGEDEKEVTKLTAVTYCQEIVNHPALIQCDGESEKLDALVEMVTEGDLEGEKVIVYTRFERMVKLGIDALTAAGVKCVRVTGAETIDQRAEAQRLFQDMNSDVKVIWITNAGGDAINLQSARALVFFDTPFSAGDYLQVVGRMIRIGSTHDRVFALHLVAKGTIDERVLAIQERKMGLLEAVIGKRILGDESSDEILTNDNDVNALFDALREDAKGLIRG
jgi:hypothetical protein